MSHDSRGRFSPRSIFAAAKAKRDQRLRARLVPGVESLEPRLVLSLTYSWNTAVAPMGGDWDTAADWSPVGIPGPSDTASVMLASPGTIKHAGSETTSVYALVTNANTTFQMTNGTLNLGPNASSLLGGTTIEPGATLNLGSGPITLGGATNVQTSGTPNQPGGTLILSSGSTTFAGSTVVQYGATMTAPGGAAVTVNGGQTLTVNGAMTLASGDTLTLAVASYSTTQLLDYGVLNATNTSFVGFGSGNAYTQDVVEPGGELIASGDTFANSTLAFTSGAVVNPTDLSNNSFNLPISIPAASVPMLSAGTGGSNNRSFQAIDILAGTQPESTLNLNAIGTAGAANLSYVFPGNFTVPSGSTLNVAANVAVTVNGGQTLTVNGAMTLASGDTLTLAVASYSTTQLLDYGVLNATNTSFVGFGSGNAYTQDVVESGGHLTASRTQFSNSSLTVTSGSYITLTASQLYNQFAVNSGATFSVTGNDFSNIGAKGVVATGDANAHIPFAGNYWGSTVPATIAAKILDHAMDATRPTVDYQPFLSYTTGTLAASKTKSFMTTAQTVTLTATVSSTSGLAINEGTETFTILNGTQVIGTTTAPVAVSNSAASAVFTIPASTSPGSYTIMATYSGSPTYGPAIDTSQFLVINPATTATTVSNISTGFLEGSSQVLSLSANITSPGGTPNEGIVTFSVFGGLNQLNSPIPVAVANGAAATNFTIPADTQAGSYTIRATYTDPTDYATSTVNGSLNVYSQTTTVTLTGASTTFTATGGQPINLSAQVTSPGGVVGEGNLTFKIVDGQGVTQGIATAGAVVNGAVAASYVLPANTPAGTYFIQASYSGTSNFLSSSATPGTLTVNPAVTAVATNPPTATFNESTQTVPLSASVTSNASGGINAGTVTFTIMVGATPIVVGPVSVSGGRASTTFTLPAAFPAGTYSIQTVYSGGGNFLGSTDLTQSLNVAKAATSVATDPASVFYIASTGQTVVLGASVSSLAGRVDASASVTFQVYSGVNPIGSPLTVDLSNGRASGAYSLPSALAIGSYTISTVFSGTGNFAGSGDRSGELLLIGSASSIVATAGTPQSAVVGTAYATPFQVTVEDQNGNAVAGVAVTFAAPALGVGGSFAAGKAVTVTTSAQGVATAPTFNAGTLVGTYLVSATVPGASSIASFSLTNTAGAASSVVATAGSGQSATVGTAFANPFQVTVEDQYGNVVGGATVTFAAPASGAGGSFAAGKMVTATTNAQGLATAPTFTAGTLAGVVYTVSATISGATPAASFSLTNTPGAASSIAATAGTPQSAVVGTAFATPFQVTVEDRYGNVVGGATVTFAALLSGPGGSFAAGKSVPVTTTAQGLATAPTFTAGTLVGPYVLTATMSVLGVSTSASFSLTNTPGLPSSIVATAGTPQTAVVGSAFANFFQATVEDKYGNAVAGASVTFAAPSSGPSGSFAAGKSVTVTTGAQGVATAPTFNAGTISGVYSVTATVSGVTAVASFSLTNKPLTVTSTTLAIQPTSASLRRPVTLTATVAALLTGSIPPTGTVKFFDGSTLLGSAPVDGTGHASFTTSTLGFGVHSITATYSGDANDATSTSTPVSVRIKNTTPGDYDGDGKSDLAVYDQTTATFSVIESGGGSVTQTLGIATHVNVPLVGDFDGDGKTDLAIYDQTAATFMILKSGGGTITQLLGNSAHVNIPLVGDFDGDGKADFAIYDQTADEFYVLKSGGGSIAQTLGIATHVNIPVSGDFDGDGFPDLAIYDQTTATFHVLKSGGGTIVQAFGNSAHVNIPVVGDFDGDGKADMAIYDQTAATFYVFYSGNGTVLTQTLGNSAHVNIPVVGDFDGDGKADMTIYDATDATFYVFYSGNGSVLTQLLGNKKHSNKPI